ncbi:unnamed protein product [Ambrosiozyma monospora]|uniref:Unnamed protein product n=1 Tax=Ambrosiozyma monospora TaxID=43982 RepID=A0ACB5T9C6_AMBMO|nr:unnamed protein product [Ambrosiozyma monospora]
MVTSKHRKPPLIPVVLACAISTFLITFFYVVFLSDPSPESNLQIFHLNSHQDEQETSKTTASNSSSSPAKHSNDFSAEEINENCLKYDYYQAKLQTAEDELANLKEQLHEKTQQSTYKIGQFDYNANDIFNYDIGKGEPSFHHLMSEYIDFYLKHKQTIMHPMREYREGSAHGKPEKVNPEEYWRTDADDPLNEETLRGFLENPKELVEELTKNHKIITDAIPSHTPFPFYKGNGYVLAGDGLYMWQALLNIEAFRALGAKLPIELLVTDESKSDDTICDVILPKLNARCIHMSTVLGKDVMSKFKFGVFQYKVLALLASRFQNVFLFDCDAMPVMNPDYLFDWDVYQSHGMLLWPDIIKRTTSPDIIISLIRKKRILIGKETSTFTIGKAPSLTGPLNPEL